MSEHFETFDDEGRPTGLVERAAVHATGLWHRSTHVWLCDGIGQWVLQRRAADKDVCPGCWDLGVGEHLQPGETFEEAAHRGLAEELGIVGVTLEPLGGVRRMRLDMPERGIRDCELQQSFRAVHAGSLHPDPIEVAEVRRLRAAALRAELAEAPERFTPWLRQDVADLGLFVGD